jgi:hypothetical protein
MAFHRLDDAQVRMLLDLGPRRSPAFGRPSQNTLNWICVQRLCAAGGLLARVHWVLSSADTYRIFVWGSR